MCNAVRGSERETSCHLMPSVDYFRSMLTMGWKEVGLVWTVHQVITSLL